MQPGHMQFKAGTKQEQHLVSIQPSVKGSKFQLIYVKVRDSEN